MLWKPLIEKQRRERMNASIDQLKMLIADTIKHQVRGRASWDYELYTKSFRIYTILYYLELVKTCILKPKESCFNNIITDSCFVNRVPLRTAGCTNDARRQG